MSVVNVWLSSEFPQILLPISLPNCIKETFLLQETSASGKALLISHLSLEPFWEMVTGVDTGQLLFSLSFISL